MSFWGRSIGTRITAIKRHDLGTVIEIWHHSLHPTKGWKLSRHFRKTVDRKEFRKAPERQAYWMPPQKRPSIEPRSLETPLTRARHHHPRSLRPLAIAAAKIEMTPKPYQGERIA